MILTVLSRCGRYRITVAPCDDGARLDFWHRSGARAGWRLECRQPVALPHHAALDLAHDLIHDHCNQTGN